ncbi:hypothetical protein Acid345_4641 [Candidatus Koribacter versatilis Ellin345]|uniref:Uncharacterized protein n=1 Tax=Koribacter versatilis (strain Ellin345) TaxID=204669 RepID=Q1IHK9_KORVE|nr:hypothetical protein [Candidatus Koribacter versatilis]ABF43641.1 hypothetical protein Acid345_4641 [Candidatus Koribacter versatilis Ellin345]
MRLGRVLFFVVMSCLTALAQMTPASCTFKTFDFGTSGITLPTGINRWGNAIGFDSVQGKEWIRFTDGRLQVLTTAARMTKRNAFGVTVGARSHKGAILTPDGKLTLLGYPGADDTNFTGINRYGTIVGQAYHQGTNAFQVTFVLRGTTFTKLPLPDGANSIVISDTGVIGGDYPVTKNGVVYVHGFIYANGKFQDWVVPNETDGDVVDINATGEIASSAALYKNGKFYSVTYPGPYNSGSIQGMNGFGNITGYYESSLTTISGFVGDCTLP